MPTENDPPTLPPASTTAPLRLPDRADATIADDGTPEHRYVLTGMLGEGGMGEVLSCLDRRIGREVAMKVALADVTMSGQRAIFLHEARVQGQLEHPSIVPVYDVGTDKTGRPYLTMKRVNGVTLEHVLSEVRRGVVPGKRRSMRYSLHKLLTAFASVCLAVHYAHTRGVLHRDLKPANIMLGDFGEVYVLDWGVAVVREGSPVGPSIARTTLGGVVGTIGYMAPEQLRGQEIDARSDVYALGSILFEILTLQPLHGENPQAAYRSTLNGVEARPSVRVPALDVPPELEAACVSATALDPAQRFQTAGELHEAIESYLEGDRDIELRRKLAEGRRVEAERDLERALRRTVSGATVAARTRAIRELASALALDPRNERASQTLLKLLTEPPEALPLEVETEMRANWRVQQRRAAWGGAMLYLAWFVYLPLGLWVGLRPTWLVIAMSCVFGAAVLSLLHASRTLSVRSRTPFAPVVFTSLALGSLSALFGPLILCPSLVLINCVGFLLQPERSRRFFVIACGCLALLVPFGLEAVGAIPHAYEFVGGQWLVLPRLMRFTGAHVLVVQTVINVTLVIFIGVFFARFRDMLSSAERRWYMHAWQLRQLIPARTRGLTPLAPPTPAPAQAPGV